LKAAQEVGFQVIKVLKTYRHPNQTLLNTRHLPLSFREPAMGGAGRVSRKCFDIA
jgi:hypothetical protein